MQKECISNLRHAVHKCAYTYVRIQQITYLLVISMPSGRVFVEAFVYWLSWRSARTSLHSFDVLRLLCSRNGRLDDKRRAGDGSMALQRPGTMLSLQHLF